MAVVLHVLDILLSPVVTPLAMPLVLLHEVMGGVDAAGLAPSARRSVMRVPIEKVTACALFAACAGILAPGIGPASAGRPGDRGLEVEKTIYGKLPDGREVDLYTLTNADGMRVRLMNYGATTIGIDVPDRAGTPADVTLGYETLEGWLGNTSYFGATVGRYANRIAKGRFTIDGRTCTLATNNGENHLHGGEKGFDKRLWDAEPVEGEDSVGVRFTYRSEDGEEGYPGNLDVTATYSLTKENEYRAEFTARTDRPTIVNLVHHSYWNLAGPAAGDILGHELLIEAEKYTPVDEGLIPTGEIAPVEGTPLDFTKPTAIGARIGRVEGGYDHNFVVRGGGGEIRRVARVFEKTSGRVMEILSDQPGIQFYSGNFLDGSVKGKGGVTYRKHHGFCLETQHFPDSPNRAHFPSTLLRPGETYRHTMIHRFSTK